MRHDQEYFIDFHYIYSAITIILLVLIAYLLIKLLKSEKKKKETESKFKQLKAGLIFYNLKISNPNSTRIYLKIF